MTLFHRAQLAAAVWGGKSLFCAIFLFSLAMALHLICIVCGWHFYATNIKRMKHESVHCICWFLFSFVCQFMSSQKVTWCDWNSTALRMCVARVSVCIYGCSARKSSEKCRHSASCNKICCCCRCDNSCHNFWYWLVCLLCVREFSILTRLARNSITLQCSLNFWLDAFDAVVTHRDNHKIIHARLR